MRNTLVEIWQANAAGRYVHKSDQHHAPLDPDFPAPADVWRIAFDIVLRGARKTPTAA